MLGKPVIRGTRVTVELIENTERGSKEEELLNACPHLCQDDIQVALAYGADSLDHDEVVLHQAGSSNREAGDAIPGRCKPMRSDLMKRDEILAILREFMRDSAEEYGILEIGIFGSTARDEAGEESDVDVVIKTKTPNPFALVHIKKAIERRTQKHVDIIRMRENMNPFLKGRIEKEARYV